LPLGAAALDVLDGGPRAVEHGSLGFARVANDPDRPAYAIVAWASTCRSMVAAAVCAKHAGGPATLITKHNQPPKQFLLTDIMHSRWTC
jgi:hypothetical protein